MAKPDPENPPPAPPAAVSPVEDMAAKTRPCHPVAPSDPAPGAKRGSLLGGVMRHLTQVGQGLASVALGKWLQEPEATPEPGEPTDPDSPADTSSERRANILHHVTEKLRGAADGYVAAKLDEMEARVDAKLDHIEQRIDQKIVELHKHLAAMRDRELRHRLRLLKITLMFTVLVALLSLGYKLFCKYWA